MKLGTFNHPSSVIVAPMAGVTDRPFRNLCRELGAYWTVSEMITSDQKLWNTNKSKQRLNYQDEMGPRWIQIAGGDAPMLAAAASAAEELGADIIDINMGCPAKKVCNKAAGSALLRDPQLVQDIFKEVVSAVSVPVTVKVRLGWSLDEINVTEIARMAQGEGLSLITVHGRSRACKFAGSVHYDEIANVVQSVTIPVVANGDIRSPQQAVEVMHQTGASAIMIGRAAQGRPWLPYQVDAFIQTGEMKKNPTSGEIKQVLTSHVRELANFYGEIMGPRIARKHVGWYLSDPSNERKSFLREFNRLETLPEQVAAIEAIFKTEGGETYVAA